MANLAGRGFHTDAHCVYNIYGAAYREGGVPVIAPIEISSRKKSSGFCLYLQIEFVSETPPR
jgi:hypothetical protein